MNLKGIKNQRDNPPGIMCWGQKARCSFFLILFYLFIWLRRVFITACGIFVAALVAACGLLSSYGVRVFSSLVGVRGLSCPAACGIFVPRPGTEPASPALEGGFFTTEPPGKAPDVPSSSPFISFGKRKSSAT